MQNIVNKYNSYQHVHIGTYYTLLYSKVDNNSVSAARKISYLINKPRPTLTSFVYYNRKFFFVRIIKEKFHVCSHVQNYLKKNVSKCY